MLRLVIPAIVAALVLAMVHPAHAGQAGAPAPDHREAAAAPVEQTPPSSSPAPSSTDVAAPAATGYLKNVIPAGFGWG